MMMTQLSGILCHPIFHFIGRQSAVREEKRCTESGLFGKLLFRKYEILLSIHEPLPDGVKGTMGEKPYFITVLNIFTPVFHGFHYKTHPN